MYWWVSENLWVSNDLLQGDSVFRLVGWRTEAVKLCILGTIGATWIVSIGLSIRVGFVADMFVCLLTMDAGATEFRIRKEPIDVCNMASLQIGGGGTREESVWKLWLELVGVLFLEGKELGTCCCGWGEDGFLPHLCEPAVGGESQHGSSASLLLPNLSIRLRRRPQGNYTTVNSSDPNLLLPPLTPKPARVRDISFQSSVGISSSAYGRCLSVNFLL